MGKLQEMLDKQAELQRRLGYDFNSMKPQERTALIKEFSLHINQELNEMLYELPFFKPWKDYSGMSDEEIEAGFEKAREEMSDLAHFINNVYLLLAMDEDEIYNYYMNKNKENHKRQDEGYTHDKQYR